MNRKTVLSCIFIALFAAGCGTSVPSPTTPSPPAASPPDLVLPYAVVVPGATGCLEMGLVPNWKPTAGPITLDVGQAILMALGQPFRYVARSFPPAFPWASPATTNAGVLAPIAICGHPQAETLPTVYAAFIAVAPGTATITADLSASWNAFAYPSSGIAPVRLDVFVAGTL